MDSEIKNSMAQELHSESIVIDTCGFFCKGYGDYLERSGITAIALTTPRPHDNFENAVQRIEEYYQLTARDSKLCLVEAAEDIRQAKKKDQVGLIIAAQNSSAVGNRIVRVETLARLGMRIMQLTYNERNYVGDGCNELTDAGLSHFGRALVHEMNRCGIVVDVSHVGARTALEAARESSKPVIASHSNPFSLFPTTKRNIKDELVDAIAESGGVIGISPYGPLNWNGDPTHFPTLEDMVNGIDYLVERVGIEHVGIGTDGVATEGAYPEDLRESEHGKPYEDHSHPTAYKEAFDVQPGSHKYKIDGYKGIFDRPKVTELLVQRGYGSEEIKKILGENFLRVFEEVWPN